MCVCGVGGAPLRVHACPGTFLPGTYFLPGDALLYGHVLFLQEPSTDMESIPTQRRKRKLLFA
jgi:hypothetical protein